MVELAIDNAHSHVATAEAAEAQQLVSSESTHRVLLLDPYVYDTIRHSRR